MLFFVNTNAVNHVIRHEFILIIAAFLGKMLPD